MHVRPINGRKGSDSGSSSYRCINSLSWYKEREKERKKRILLRTSVQWLSASALLLLDKDARSPKRRKFARGVDIDPEIEVEPELRLHGCSLNAQISRLHKAILKLVFPKDRYIAV